eukprot:scpid109855/ scgid33904/ Uncharacterized protein K02A2.6
MENVSLSDEELVNVQVLLIDNDQVAKADTVRAETANDPVLSKVLQYVRNGWPSVTPAEFQSYVSKRMELSIEDDVLLWGNRVIVPTSLRMVLLQDFHAEHFGMVKTKQMARMYMWWPNID